MHYKQIVLSVVIFSLAVYITLATAYAQVASSSSAKMPSTSEVNSYQLPYPGMLPDNPLYFLKVFRDDLTALFLGKPLDKAEFDLLQSDKNVEASYLLVTQQQGKAALAWTTFSTAQDYFDQAISQTESAQKQGYSVKDISKRLATANQKHVQTLQAVAQQTNQKNSQAFQTELNRTDTFTKAIKTLHQ